MIVYVAHHLCLMPSAAAPAQQPEREGQGGRLPGGQGSGVKGHVPDRRTHMLIENSATVTELAGGRCILPPNANYSFLSFFVLVLALMYQRNI